MATPDLQPPYPVAEGTLSVKIVADALQIEWTAPAYDATHGPADRYSILRGHDPGAELPEVSEVTETLYQEPLSETAEASFTCYHILAGNAAGDTP